MDQEETSDKIFKRGTTLVAFLLPLKLSLAYIALSPLILFWVYKDRTNFLTSDTFRKNSRIIAPLLLFLLLAILSAAFGVSPGRSFKALSSLLFFALTIPLFASKADAKSACLALIAGQSIASLHSFLEAALPGVIPSLFLGKVTESGQLAITLVATIGVIYSQRTQATSKENRILLALAITTTLLLSALGFGVDLNLTHLSKLLLTMALVSLLAATVMIARSALGSLKEAILATCIAMPLMTCALLVNLKRGPWLGVLVGCVCFACFYSRKLIAPLAAAAICAAVVVTPIKERILDSYEHFTISGGRSTIWRIGAELVSEYPLGIGYHNSGILREFSPEIPPELKHFHNNLINIAAEMGWLGVLVFIWLIAAIVKTCFSNRNKPLYVALGCAVISWQCAGLVEYNFGDSEVTILAWMLLGLILKQGTTSPA